MTNDFTEVYHSIPRGNLVLLFEDGKEGPSLFEFQEVRDGMVIGEHGHTLLEPVILGDIHYPKLRKLETWCSENRFPLNGREIYVGLDAIVFGLGNYPHLTPHLKVIHDYRKYGSPNLSRSNGPLSLLKHWRSPFTRAYDSFVRLKNRWGRPQ